MNPILVKARVVLNRAPRILRMPVHMTALNSYAEISLIDSVAHAEAYSG